MSKSKVYLRITLSFYLEKDGRVWYAHCPNLKGLHAEGNTAKEAVKNADEAARAYLDSLLKHNEPLPCCTVVRQEIPENTKVVRKTYTPSEVGVK